MCAHHVNGDRLTGHEAVQAVVERCSMRRCPRRLCRDGVEIRLRRWRFAAADTFGFTTREALMEMLLAGEWRGAGGGATETVLSPSEGERVVRCRWPPSTMPLRPSMALRPRHGCS